MALARAKFWIPFLGVVGAIALGSQWLAPGDDPAEVAAPAIDRSPAPAAPSARTESELTLPQRGPIAATQGDAARDIFSTKSWYVPPPPPPPQPVVAPPPPPPPQAPALPFQFMGWMDDGDQVRAFLSRGDKVYAVGAGDQLEGSYRVEKLEPTHITFLYLPLSQAQSLNLGGGLPAAVAPSLPTPAPGASATPPAMASTVPATPALPATAALPNDADIAGTEAGNPAEVAGVAAPVDASAASIARRIRMQDVLDRGRSRRVVRR